MMQTLTSPDVPIYTAVDTAQDVHSVSKILGCHHKVEMLTANNRKFPLQPNTTEFTDSAVAQTAKYNRLGAKQTVNAALLGHYFTALIWSVLQSQLLNLSKSSMLIIMNKEKKIIRKCLPQSHWNDQEFVEDRSLSACHYSCCHFIFDCPRFKVKGCCDIATLLENFIDFTELMNTINCKQQMKTVCSTVLITVHLQQL